MFRQFRQNLEGAFTKLAALVCAWGLFPLLSRAQDGPLSEEGLELAQEEGKAYGIQLLVVLVAAMFGLFVVTRSSRRREKPGR